MRNISDIRDAISDRNKEFLCQPKAKAATPQIYRLSPRNTSKIAPFIRDDEIKKPAIAGYSLGGLTAMMIGARHRNLVPHNCLTPLVL
jgi:enterochelin esterase-like enzyme